MRHLGSSPFLAAVAFEGGQHLFNMTEQAGISDLTHSPDAHRKLLMWTAAAIAIPSAGALLWWLSEKGYNSLTPYKASTVTICSCGRRCSPLVKPSGHSWDS